MADEGVSATTRRLHRFRTGSPHPRRAGLVVLLVVALIVWVAPAATSAAPAMVVTPSTALVDGQVVQIALSGFPQESAIRVALCPAGETVTSLCDRTSANYAFADMSGNAAVSLELTSRLTDHEGGVTDCRGTACQIVAFVYEDGVLPVASSVLEFDPAGPLPDPPTVAVDRSTDLVDGDLLHLTGAGFRADTWISARTCAEVVDETVCRSLADTESTDSAGNLDTHVRVRAAFGGWGESADPIAVDCRTNTTCRLVVITPRGGLPAPIPLHFDPGSELQPSAQVAVVPATGLVDGQSVSVTVTGAESNRYLDIQTCAYDESDQLLGCEWADGLRADALGNATWSMTVRALVADMSSGGEDLFDCRVVSCRFELFDHSTGRLVSADLEFDPDGRLLPPPSISVNPAGDVVEGQVLVVEGHGFTSGDHVSVQLCVVDGGCDANTSDAEVDESGSLTTELTPWATFTADGEPVDCRTAPGCEVVARGSHPRDRAAAPITFAPPLPSRGRYLDPVFDDVEITHDVVYRTAIDHAGNVVELKLDIYEPAGDTATRRPAIMWMHGGWFSFGDKTQLAPYILESTRRGYVGVGLQYRLRPGVGSGDLPEAIEAAEDAYDDAAAAVEWLAMNASTYRIDPRAIIGAGYSAGAVLAYNLDWLPGAVPVLGDGDPSRTQSLVAGVVAIAGLPFAGPSAGDTPVIGFHGTRDGILPIAPARDACAAAATVQSICEWVEYAGGDHYIAIDQFRHIVRRSHEFLYENVLSPLGYAVPTRPPGPPVRPEVAGPPTSMVGTPTTSTPTGAPTTDPTTTAPGATATTVPGSTTAPTGSPTTAPASGVGVSIDGETAGGTTSASPARPVTAQPTYAG